MQPTLPQQAPASNLPIARLIVGAIVAFVGVLMAAAAALWAHYGTAVFYEMIVAGIAACF